MERQKDNELMRRKVSGREKKEERRWIDRKKKGGIIRSTKKIGKRYILEEGAAKGNNEKSREANTMRTLV